jgi:hypothetical protein
MMKDGYGYIVCLSDIILTPAGYFHGLDLASTIFRTYGMKYVLDMRKTFPHSAGCQCGSNATSTEATFTYVLEPLQTHSAGVSLSSHITVSSRKTFLKLEKAPVFKMRKYHPKSGFNSILYQNDSETLLLPRDKHFLTRHKLHASSQNQHVSQHNSERERDRDSGVTNHVDKSTIISDSDRPLSRGLGGGGTEHHSVRGSSQTSPSISPIPFSHSDTSPTTPSSVTQLLYLIDRSAPSPIREALVQGVGWWDEAFQYVRKPLLFISLL